MATYYVNNVDGNDENLGTSANLSLMTMDRAISKASSNDTIRVSFSNTSYSITNNAITTKALSILGEENKLVKIEIATFLYTNNLILKNIHFIVNGGWNTSNATSMYYEDCIFEGLANNYNNNYFWGNVGNTVHKNILIKNFGRNLADGISVSLIGQASNVTIQESLGVIFQNAGMVSKVVVETGIKVSPLSADFIFSEDITVGEYGFIKPIINKTLILHDGEYKKKIANTKATPIMTSSTTPSGIVAQSSSYSDFYEGWKLFSEDLYDASGWNTEYYVTSGWVSYKFESPVTITKYSIRPRYNQPTPDPNNILQMANTWNLEGSNNGIDWTVLDSQVGQTWKQGEVKEFKMQSTGSYFYYRLNVLNNNESNYGIAVGRLNLFQDVGWSTVSSNLPTVQQFLSDGMDSLSPLLDRKVETLDPIQMQSKSDILPVGSEGKVFSKIIDLNKYFDIRSMKVEVK